MSTPHCHNDRHVATVRRPGLLPGKENSGCANSLAGRTAAQAIRQPTAMSARSPINRPAPKPHRSRAGRMAGAASITLAGALGISAYAGGLATDSAGCAEDPGASKREWAVSLRWENDTFGGSDRFYTDGVSLAVSHTGPSWLDSLANCLPWGAGRRTVGYDIAQGMFTPSDSDINPPDPKDRPYAGILAFGLTLHVEKENAYHGLKFVTGVVGPWSLAEETQNWVHGLIGNDKAQGWDHQLDNEPIFNIAYEYRRKFHLAGDRQGWSAQAFPIAGGWLGNMLIQGQAGALLQFGYNVPDDFGPTLVRGMGHMPPPRRAVHGSAKSDWGVAVYGGSVANLVLHDITLDGNTFEDSPSVDRKLFVPAAGVGMTVGNRRFQASFAYVFWGKEFEGQKEYSKFGSLTFSYMF